MTIYNIRLLGSDDDWREGDQKFMRRIEKNYNSTEVLCFAQFTHNNDTYRVYRKAGDENITGNLSNVSQNYDCVILSPKIANIINDSNPILSNADTIRRDTIENDPRGGIINAISELIEKKNNQNKSQKFILKNNVTFDMLNLEQIPYNNILDNETDHKVKNAAKKDPNLDPKHRKDQEILYANILDNETGHKVKNTAKKDPNRDLNRRKDQKTKDESCCNSSCNIF